MPHSHHLNHQFEWNSGRYHTTNITGLKGNCTKRGDNHHAIFCKSHQKLLLIIHFFNTAFSHFDIEILMCERYGVVVPGERERKWSGLISHGSRQWRYVVPLWPWQTHKCVDYTQHHTLMWCGKPSPDEREGEVQNSLTSHRRQIPQSGKRDKDDVIVLWPLNVMQWLHS